METQFATNFINAWNMVVESFSSKKIIRSAVQEPNETCESSDISVIMGLVGDVTGQIYMTMDAHTGKLLASEMLGGMEINDVDELVISAVGEFCNMVMGNACSSISSDDKSVDITPPTVLADQLPMPQMKSSYNISFVIEDMSAIDFNVAVNCA
jgi:chemotaxis protein CheX